MRKNLVLKMVFSVLAFSLVIAGCTSTGTTVSNVLSDVVGKWRSAGEFDGPGYYYSVMDIGSNGRGRFKIYQSGTLVVDRSVNVTQNGQITIDNKNVQHTFTDVIVNGKYLGKKITIKGFIDNDLAFYKTNPPQNISLAGTSWHLESIDTSYLFNEKGTFKIDLGSQVQSFATSAYSNVGTEGTYSINGNEVTLTYPNGVRVIAFYRSNDGGVSMQLSRNQSLVIYIEGIDLVVKGTYFGLVTE
jgi:hypothetical protein